MSAPRRKTVIRAFPGPRGGSCGTLMSFSLPLGDQDLLGRCQGRELASVTPLLGLQTLKPLPGCRATSLNVLPGLQAEGRLVGGNQDTYWEIGVGAIGPHTQVSDVPIQRSS